MQYKAGWARQVPGGAVSLSAFPFGDQLSFTLPAMSTTDANHVRLLVDNKMPKYNA